MEGEIAWPGTGGNQSEGLIPSIPAALLPGLDACSRSRNDGLTRGELAAVLGRSKRTIARWEGAFGLAVDRRNERVLRYSMGSLVGLVSRGEVLEVHEAERLGLNPTAILSLASAICAYSQMHVAQPDNVVFVAESDTDRRLIAAWRDPALGPVLRKIVCGLTDESIAKN